MSGLGQPGVRSLRRLYNSGSTSRLLNLLHISNTAQAARVKLDPPMFRNPKLNGMLVVKHQLRHNEKVALATSSHVVTKLIVPVDANNLAVGGHFTYVGEAGWLNGLERVMGSLGKFESDIALLLSLDRVPSFDPFLLREWLSREGFNPSSGYFSINASDVALMESFVYGEISILVSLSLGGHGEEEGTRNLVRKMMHPSGQDDLKALRNTLKLSIDEFSEGIFCWRGFLFYKWNLSRISERLPTMLHELKARVRTCMAPREVHDRMESARIRVTKRIIEICRTAESILADYDKAYSDLTSQRDPAGFRSFLLSAPSIFVELGGAVGQVNHVLQFWAYRTARAPGGAISIADLDDLLKDFEDGLATAVK